MRLSFRLMLAASLTLHVGAGAVLVRRADERVDDPPSTTPVLTGETFDLSESLKATPETVASPSANQDPSPNQDPGADPSPSPRPSPRSRASTSPAAAHSGTLGSTSAAPETFGALGDRSAVDVSVAFTRAFPQAASGDPIWSTVALGSAGQLLVELDLDESGKLTPFVNPTGASVALRQGVERTLALIGTRTFVSTDRAVELRVSATVSADTVHDGLHGDVFAVGGSYSGGEGNAFFALATGRRVDVTVRAIAH